MRDPKLPLDELLDVHPDGDGRYVVDVPDGWQQGRGLFGGLVTGLLVRALEAHRPDRPLRSLTAEIAGPVQPGLTTIEVGVVRDGNAVSTLTARLLQEGEVLAHGVGVLGRGRTQERDGVYVAAPPLGDWRALPTLPIRAPMGPVFGQHWVYRTDEHPPFAGAAVPAAGGWIAPARPGARRDAAFLAACIDAWWPATFAQETGPRPMATIAFTFQPVGDFEGLDPEAPLRYRAQVVAARDGYAVELRELWGADGRLLALNQQTMCLIK